MSLLFRFAVSESASVVHQLGPFPTPELIASTRSAAQRRGSTTASTAGTGLIVALLLAGCSGSSTTAAAADRTDPREPIRGDHTQPIAW
jgi:hypothetical protein